jgi:hypothetical protein
LELSLLGAAVLVRLELVPRQGCAGGAREWGELEGRAMPLGELESAYSEWGYSHFGKEKEKSRDEEALV